MDGTPGDDHLNYGGQEDRPGITADNGASDMYPAPNGAAADIKYEAEETAEAWQAAYQQPVPDVALYEDLKTEDPPKLNPYEDDSGAQAYEYQYKPEGDADPASAGTSAPFAPQQNDGPETSVEPQLSLKKRNRWGPAMYEDPSFAAEAGEGEQKKKRRSRWETNEVALSSSTALMPKFPKELTLPGGIQVRLPPHLTGDPSHADPVLKRLHDELTEINRKLLHNDFDIPPEGQRSPSPEPVYDKNGIRLNTREIRYREKMVQRRNDVIEELIKEDQNFKPPPDYKPQKKWRKIYIPVKEYPGYNFIGLIIGPRGNTQKRMQKETNTKIAIRGKGSVKEGAARDPKYDYGEDEELHVLITGDTQDDVDAAAKMIEELLEPMDEARNEHKRLQLRELAALNGTLKDDQACYLCGDFGHRSYECPKKTVEVYQLPDDIKQKVQEQYERDVARLNPEMAGKMDDEYKNFLRELGGAPPPELMGQEAGGDRGKGGDRPKRPGDDLPDTCKLYVGNLSMAISDAVLQAMFEPFGHVLYATVLQDATTGGSRGFGFVHFENPDVARTASEGMHGKTIDGRQLVVRVRSDTDRGPRAGLGAPRESKFSERTGPPEYEYDPSKLYVSYLPPSVSEPQLQQLFNKMGGVTDIKLIMDRNTGQSKGYAFITMATPGAAQEAIRTLNGYKVEGKQISVKIAGAGGGKPDAPEPARAPGGPPHTMGPGAYARPAMPGPYPGAPAPYPGAPHMPPGYAPPPGAPHMPPGYGYPPPGTPGFMPPGARPGPYPGAPGMPGGIPPGMPGYPGPHGYPPPGSYPPPGMPVPGYYPPPGAMPGMRPGGYPMPGQVPGAMPGHPGQHPGHAAHAMPVAQQAPAQAQATAPPAAKVESEYEKFMREMGKGLQ